jgi:hypothetical protein
MVEKTIGGKNGKIHFEFDLELPGLKESAEDFLSFMKAAADEMVDVGRKVASKGNTEKREIKKINIK